MKLKSVAEYAKDNNVSRQWVNEQVRRAMDADNHKKSWFKRENIVILHKPVVRIKDEEKSE